MNDIGTIIEIAEQIMLKRYVSKVVRGANSLLSLTLSFESSIFKGGIRINHPLIFMFFQKEYVARRGVYSVIASAAPSSAILSIFLMASGNVVESLVFPANTSNPTGILNPEATHEPTINCGTEFLRRPVVILGASLNFPSSSKVVVSKMNLFKEMPAFLPASMINKRKITFGIELILLE